MRLGRESLNLFPQFGHDTSFSKLIPDMLPPFLNGREKITTSQHIASPTRREKILRVISSPLTYRDKMVPTSSPSLITITTRCLFGGSQLLPHKFLFHALNTSLQIIIGRLQRIVKALYTKQPRGPVLERKELDHER